MKNICIIGVNKRQVKHIAKRVSQKMDFIYKDVVQDISNILIDNQQGKILNEQNNLQSLENEYINHNVKDNSILYCLDYFILNNKQAYNKLKEKCIFVYLYFNQQDYHSKLVSVNKTDPEYQLHMDLYRERNIIIKKYADIVVDCSFENIYSATYEIINAIKNFLGENK